VGARLSEALDEPVIDLRGAAEGVEQDADLNAGGGALDQSVADPVMTGPPVQ
jgi:hypothetical protein